MDRVKANLFVKRTFCFVVCGMLLMLASGQSQTSASVVSRCESNAQSRPPIHRLSLPKPFDPVWIKTRGTSPSFETIPLSAADTTFFGETTGDGAGNSIAGVGDVNGDGYDDLLIAASSEDSNGEDAGAAYLYWGPVSGTLDLSTAPVKLLGKEAGSRFGMMVNRAGDVNRDGYSDFLVAAMFEDAGGFDSGAAYLFYGSPQLPLAYTKIIGERGDFSGLSSGGVDVNGDGYDDIVVSSWFRGFDGKEETGITYLFWGPLPEGTISLNDADAYFVGEGSFDLSGMFLAIDGDVNGDGLSDILIGAPAASQEGEQKGYVYLVLGSSDLQGYYDLSLADLKLIGEFPSDGAYVASFAGDVDGDHRSDLIVGAAGEELGEEGAGSAYLILASDVLERIQSSEGGVVSDIGEMAATKFIGECANDWAGTMVSETGDANNDGYDDFLIGAPGNYFISGRTGAAYLVFGGEGMRRGEVSLARGADIKFVGSPRGDDHTGAWVSGGGDVNGDGTSDLLIGAFSSDELGEETQTLRINAGAAYLILGNPSW